MVKNKRRKSIYKTRVGLIAAVILGLAIIGGLIVHALHKTVTMIPARNTSNPTSNKPNTTEPIPQNGSAKSSVSTGFTSPANTGYGGGSSLIMPSGTLVSNHRPSLSSSSLSGEQSVCNTSPGASCYIEFTKGNEVKKLPVQTTDSNGSTYWTWDVGQAGLGAGSWKITAVASLSGQTKTFDDSLTLDVQP